MKKTCFLVALTLLPLGVPTPANAQTAPHSDTRRALSEKQATDGEVPTECGGPWSGQGGSCNFQCRAGDILYVQGSARFDGRGALVRVRASCGGMTLECFAGRRPFYAACQATSAHAGPSFDDPSGSCVVEGLAGGTPSDVAALHLNQSKGSPRRRMQLLRFWIFLRMMIAGGPDRPLADGRGADNSYRPYRPPHPVNGWSNLSC